MQSEVESGDLNRLSKLFKYLKSEVKTSVKEVVFSSFRFLKRCGSLHPRKISDFTLGVSEYLRKVMQTISNNEMGHYSFPAFQ